MLKSQFRNDFYHYTSQMRKDFRHKQSLFRNEYHNILTHFRNEQSIAKQRSQSSCESCLRYYSKQ